MKPLKLTAKSDSFIVSYYASNRLIKPKIKFIEEKAVHPKKGTKKGEGINAKLYILASS